LATHELDERPADLIQRYRILCEASGIARANRVPLAPAVQAELSDLQRRLLTLLSAEPGGVRDARETVTRRERTTVEPPRHLKPVPRVVVEGDVVDAGATPPADPAHGRLSATVFTDGAAEGNPGPGGYCAIVRIPGHPDRELSGSSIHTTNNKMELTAAIAGLRAAVEAGADDITVVTDSEYLVKGMTEWLPEWERRGWKTWAGQPVKNQDLWQQLVSLTRGRTVRWQWIRGHAGHPENERCDLVATASARRAARARPT
jgi:ribonuclease HI